MENKELTEITRSFSRKLNLGRYETADFFCSQKLEVPIKEAEEASKQAFHFCKMMVEQDVQNYITTKNVDVPFENNIIDMSNLAENKPKGYFKKAKKLSVKDGEAKREADMQAAINDKQEAQYNWSPDGFVRKD